jgi:hypothetical protein
VAEIFLCPTGAIGVGTRRALAKAGVIVVETDAPDACKFVRAGEIVSGSAMLAAALTALTLDGYVKEARELFVKRIAAAANKASDVS